MKTDIAPIVTEAEKKELDGITLDLTLARKSVVANVLLMGQGLKRAHEICSREGEQGFRAYLRSVDIGKSWAYAAIKAFVKVGNRPTVGQLAVRTVFALTCDTMPDDDREEVLEKIESGELKDDAAVVEEVKKRKPPKKDKPAKAEKPSKKPRIQNIEGDEAPADDPTFEHADPDDVPPMLQRDDDEPDPSPVPAQPRRREPEPNHIGDAMDRIEGTLEAYAFMAKPLRVVLAEQIRERLTAFEGA